MRNCFNEGMGALLASRERSEWKRDLRPAQRQGRPPPLLEYVEVSTGAGADIPGQALDILRDHVGTVLDHFRGSVFCWDVVNEGLDDEGGWREDSRWFELVGPEYLSRAFRWAHEADPDAQLFYND